MSDRESKLRIYSLGIVVETKQEGSDQIVVLPIEELPNFKGPASTVTQLNETIPDATGSKKTTQVQKQYTVIASWIPFSNSNRQTAPDVVKNETVVIWRFADESQYYWNTIFREPTLRRQETVIYAFSNLPSGMTAFDLTTSYWVKIDTKHKSVHLHLSNNDKEPAGYDVIFDTAQGTVTLKDTFDNSIILESVIGHLTANINNQVEVNTIDTIINSTKTVQVNTTDTTINTSNSITVNTQTATVNASSETTIHSPTTHVTGDLNVDGEITGGKSIAAAQNLSAGQSISGANISSNGPIAAGSEITAGSNITAGGSITGSNFP
jgi:hypothetical protein